MTSRRTKSGVHFHWSLLFSIHNAFSFQLFSRFSISVRHFACTENKSNSLSFSLFSIMSYLKLKIDLLHFVVVEWILVCFKDFKFVAWRHQNLKNFWRFFLTFCDWDLFCWGGENKIIEEIYFHENFSHFSLHKFFFVQSRFVGISDWKFLKNLRT